MMDIMKLITEQITSQNTLSKLGGSVGAEPSQVEQIVKLGMPAILQALGRNAGTNDGAAALTKALEQHQDDTIDDIDGFFNNVDADDGAKILNHVFGGNNTRVQNNIAKTVGLESNQVSGVMSQLAPLLMGALGQQKKKQQLDTSGIAGLLSGMLSQSGDSGAMGMISNLLDSDNDGNVMDDISKLFGGFLKR